MGLLPHTFCLPGSPARWSSLVGLVWLGVEVGAFFRETKGWGREDVPLGFQIQALGRLLYIWKGLKLRPTSQHGGRCWH